jgi:hypothetical protein
MALCRPCSVGVILLTGTRHIVIADKDQLADDWFNNEILTPSGEIISDCVDSVANDH